MVELREPLDDLIHSPWQFTAGTTFPRANEIRRYDAERRAARSDHADEIRTYCHNLNSLGLTEEDLVSYALVLGPELK